jgi:hypothetical protein
MPDDPLPALVADLIRLGVSMVVKGGQPHLHYDEADWQAKEAAKKAAPELAANRDRAVELFQRSLTAAPALPVQCQECRGWVWSLSLIRDGCRLGDPGRPRPCGFRPT